MAYEILKDVLPPTTPGERHVAAILLVDKSGSMYGAPIAELNQGLVEFGQALQEDQLALGRADISVISFDSSVHTEVGFRPGEEYQAPSLSADGGTSMNQAIEKGLDAIEARKQEYREQGISYYRPWMFVMTDGAPTDTFHEATAKSRLRKAIEDKKVVYLPMGIGPNADTAKLRSYYPEGAISKPVLTADAAHFKEAFVWLSNSISVVTNSDPSVVDEVTLPPTPSMITVGL